jgi:hypothetical protein
MGHFLKVSLKEPVFFDPGPVIEATLASPEIQAKSAAYDLKVKLDPHPPDILCDPTSLGEMLRNLLDNAYDATPEGGTVSVRGYRKGRSSFALSIRDSGSSKGSWTRAAARSRSRAGWGGGPCSSSSSSAAKRSERP